MSPLQTLSLLVLAGYAIYRQTRPGEVAGADRFTVALVYAGVAGIALFASGQAAPRGIGWALFVAGIGLSAVVGTARGMLTRIWVADDGRAMRAGTMLTVALFIAMLAVKVGLGVYARRHGVEDGASFGEILLVVAIMVAVQAEIVFRRAAASQRRATGG